MHVDILRQLNFLDTHTYCSSASTTHINFREFAYFTALFIEKHKLLSCRYLYYEEASLTDENVMFVMYAARKYRVTPLIDICGRHFDTAINVHRVLGMLRQSLTFADEGLRDRCLSLVRSSTGDVLCGQQFVDIDEDVLTMIVD